MGQVARQKSKALTGLYGKIRTRSPQATVVVAGYPRIFNGEDCNAGTWFSPEEEAALNATADRLNAVTRTAATNAGRVSSERKIGRVRSDTRRALPARPRRA